MTLTRQEAQAALANAAKVFELLNDKAKQAAEPLFIPLPKARQLPILRGLKDCRGQLDLFTEMEVA